MRDLWQSLLDGEQESWRLLLAEAEQIGEFEMSKETYTISINGQVVYQDSDHDRARRNYGQLKAQTSGHMVLKDQTHNQILDDRASLIPLSEQVQDLIAVECAIQREWDALQAVPSYVERFKEEIMPEQPITIESDFMFVDHAEQSCKDPVCPCRSDLSILVNLSEHLEIEYDRVDRSIVLYRGPAVLAVLNREETYRLLALLHAEMPASS